MCLVAATPSISYSITVRLELPAGGTAISRLTAAVEQAGGVTTALDVTASGHDRLRIDVTDRPGRLIDRWDPSRSAGSSAVPGAWSPPRPLGSTRPRAGPRHQHCGQRRVTLGSHPGIGWSCVRVRDPRARLGEGAAGLTKSAVGSRQLTVIERAGSRRAVARPTACASALPVGAWNR